MCCGTPSSPASSPIVRKARSLLRIGEAIRRSVAASYPLAHDLTGAEGEHATRRDRHLDAGLRIAADPFALVAKDEAAEARYLHILPIGEGGTHVVEDALDDSRRIGA